MTKQKRKAEEIFIYDGECKFCIVAKDMVEKRDRRKVFRAVAANSREGQYLRERYNLDTDKSAYVISEEEILEKSDMATHILSHMGPLEKFVAIVAKILPKRLSDAIYSLVVRFRK
jgi:predicted DCC family thiol-disulfide oxidoreductase YuxK